MKILRAPLLLLLNLSFALPAARAEFETPIALINAKIVRASGEVIDNGTIVIEGKRIIAVGAEVNVPPHAETLDASGLVIYPGFIDANTHMGIMRKEPNVAERARVEDEYPDVRQGPHSKTVEAYRRSMHPEWRAEELFAAKSAKADEFRKNGFTVALVSPKPAIFSGCSAVIAMGDLPLRRSLIKTDVAEHAAFVRTSRRGSRPTPGSPRTADTGPRYPVTTMGAMAAFRQIMLDAQWHRELLEWSKTNKDGDRVALDRDLEVLLKVLDGDLPVVFIANKENEIHRALDMAAEFGLRPIIAGAREGWRAVERLRDEQVPVILSLKWTDDPGKKYKSKKKPKGKKGDKTKEGEEEDKPDPRAKLKVLFDEKWEKKPFETQKMVDERIRLWGEEVDNAKVLHEAGVKFAIGSFEMKSTKNVLPNLRKAIERGLPEEAALASLTHQAAALLGVADQVGDIAPGMLANLTVMTKPLSDEKSKVEWVFVDGKRFDVSAIKSTKPSKTKDKNKGEEQKEEEEEEEEEEEKQDEQKVASTEAEEAGSKEQPEKEGKKKDRKVVVKDAPVFASEIEADRKPKDQTGGDLLIKNATLLTITGGDLPGTDLLVRAGKISKIGQNLQAPEGVKSVDLSGYFVMPGMIDAHSHMCTDGGLNESSMSVTCEVRARDVIDHRDTAAFRALAGGVTMIHTMHGSANTMGGQNAVLRLKYGKPAADWLFRPAPRTVKFALGENVKQSNFGRKGTRFPNTRMGVEAVFRRSFDAARKYMDDRARFEKDKSAGQNPKPLRRDLRLQALAEIYNGDIWVHCHCYRADEILRLLAMAEDYGFRISVLQHVLEGYRIIPEIVRHGCGASTFSDWWAYKLEAFDAIPHNAARMSQGGVIATVNSDSAEVVRHMNLEAAKSLRFGALSPNEALRLVTINGAIQLGVDGYAGSLEPGKLADLAVFDGHPLDTFSRCVLTLIDGEIYFQHGSFDLATPSEPMSAREMPAYREPLTIEQSSTGNYWITGATIHPISAPAIPNGLLSISGDQIAWVGPNEGRRPPPGATIIDAAGLHVYPGLINAGTNLGMTEIGSVAGSVDVSEIGAFQPDLMAVSAYNPHSGMIEVTRNEGVTTAAVVVRGATVAGRAGAVRMAGWSMPEAVVKQDVGLCVSLPSLPVDYPREMTEEEKKRDRQRKKEHRKKVVEVEDFFRKARRYADVSALAESDSNFAPEHDRQLQAMIPYMRRERPILFSADSYKKIQEALEFAKRYEVRPVIYGGREAWKLADRLAEEKVDVIITRSMVNPRGKFEPWDSIYRNAAQLADAGVRFCFATGGASLAKQLGIEAGMAVAHGLEEDRAMRAITLDAAEILGLGHTHGSLEQGKTADVIITTDSPMQAANSVVAVFISGRPVDLSSRHTRQDDKFLARPQPNLGEAPDLRGPPAIRTPAMSRGL